MNANADDPLVVPTLRYPVLTVPKLPFSYHYNYRDFGSE
jgi:hypothetical protein